MQESSTKLLDRYFAALRVLSHWTEHAPFEQYGGTVRGATWVFTDLVDWSAQSGQTAERVRAAFERLRRIDWEILHLADGLKSDYILARRFVEGDARAGAALFRVGYPNGELATRLSWVRLMRWEPYRELRMLNIETNDALPRLSTHETWLREGVGIAGDRRTRNWYKREFPPLGAALEIHDLGTMADLALALFETNRRAALLRLAWLATGSNMANCRGRWRSSSTGFLNSCRAILIPGSTSCIFPTGFRNPRRSSKPPTSKKCVTR